MLNCYCAQGIATGKYHGAVLTNNEDWELKAIEAGRSSGDLLHPIVYCPELHFSEFASSVADMKNSVGVSTFFFNRFSISSYNFLLWSNNGQTKNKQYQR